MSPRPPVWTAARPAPAGAEQDLRSQPRLHQCHVQPRPRQVSAFKGVCILLVMTFALAIRINAISVALAVCWAGFGAFAGFLLGGWWAAATGAAIAGLGAGAGLFFYRRRLTASRRAAETRGHAEGTADAVLMGIALYQAAVFPFTPDAVNEEEQQARRTVAYRLADYDGLPRAVRVSAAAAPEATSMKARTPNAPRQRSRALTVTVYDCRADR
jgi:hypothetical protein